MRHYFYFKKGKMVPQWLLRQRDADTKEALSVAQFKVNGKVMVDDKTGDAIIWPASKRFKHMIYVKGDNLLLDTDDANSLNSFFGYSHRIKPTFFSQRKGEQLTSPLTCARVNWIDIHTTTKCKPIPDNFDRLGGV